MKKISNILIVSAFCAFAISCSKENAGQLGHGFVEKEFKASAEDTKTAISNGHTVWTADDAIRVWWGPAGSETAKIKAGEGTSSATYTVAVPETVTDYYAVYPAGAESSLSAESVMSIAVAAKQNGQFAQSHIAAAKAKDNVLNFKNVSAILKFVLPSAGCTKIEVESLGGEALAGSMSVSFAQGVEVTGVTASSSKVEISGATLAAGIYYLSVLPGVTHSKGLAVKYYDGEGLKGTYCLDKEISTQASVMLSFGEFEPMGEYYVAPAGVGGGLTSSTPMGLQTFVNLLTKDLDDAQIAPAKLAAINGATFHLDAGTYDFEKLLTIAFDGVESPVQLKFTGEQGTVITGADSHRLLVVGAGVKAQFENITFCHSLSNVSSEPAIMFKSGADIKMKNCAVTDNVNTTSTKNNTAAGISADADVALEIDGCEFARNTASWGASLIIKGSAKVSNTSFHHNTGNNGPGNSIYFDSASGVLDVENCTFTDNTSNETHGGAVAATGGVMNFKGCKFENNAQTNKNGAAIRLWNAAKATLENCSASGNHSNYGGAFYLENTSILTISGGTFEGNYAKGGGLVNISGDSSFTIKDGATVKGNYATNGHGGAILMGSTGKVTCEGVTFEENINKSTSAGIFGAAIAGTDKGTFTVKNCTFRGNHSDCYGGSAINLQGTANMTLSNSIFESNYNEAKGIASGNNNGNYGGGAMRLNTKGTVTIDDCVFKNNHIEPANDYNHTYGGAIYFNTGGTFMLNKCRFEGNWATRGGALCSWATGAKVYLNSCVFTGNWISYRYGTTVHVEKAGEFCMNNCSVADDTYTVGGTGDWQSCWLNLSTVTDALCISNCSLIGSTRTGEDAIAQTSGKSALVRFDALGSNKNYIVNSIIAPASAESDTRSLANYNMTVTSAYSKTGSNDDNNAGGSLTFVESPAGDGYAGTSDIFGDLQWKSGSSWNDSYWAWNGTITGGNNPALCPAAVAQEYIGKVSGFKSWLDSIGATDKDQLGNGRGTGEWWPGAYQK